ncbi:MAG: stage II sporulation protein M [bacterium]
MIFDVEKFIAQNQAKWKELEKMLDLIHNVGIHSFDFEKTNKFYNLYHQASSDLNRLQTFSYQTELITYLEGLVARAYAKIYSLQREKWRVKIKDFYFVTFPNVFRRHIKLFYLAVTIMLIGAFFGGLAVLLDPQAKGILIDFSHLKESPYERVLKEEKERNKDLDNSKVYFSSFLMTHNIKVALLTLALGVTFGFGTLILLFYNGVILGAIVADYIRYGVGTFATAWLLPHGAFEIWAILIAGQTGFLIAKSLLHTGRHSRATQLTMVGRDILTLFFGLATMLIWAGIIESFFSQYHQPVLPYSFKIGFGIVEVIFLCYYLGWIGINPTTSISFKQSL